MVGKSVGVSFKDRVVNIGAYQVGRIWALETKFYVARRCR